MSLKPLTPPLRFSTVAFSPIDQSPYAEGSDPRTHPHHRESVYRGAYPKSRNLYFLSRLHLRTVLSLTPRPLDNDATLTAWSSHSEKTSSEASLADKASKHGIQLLHVRCEKPKDESGGLTREGAVRALSILLDRRNHPIYVHCLDGVEVTSTLIACMRKVQAWSTPAILAELGRALRDSNSSEWTEVPSHLSSFLNKFGQPDGIKLPPRNHIPSWLWPAPNPLSILADPYAWAYSSHAPGSANSPNHSSATNSNGDAAMSRSPSQAPSDAGQPPIPQPIKHDRLLPIHHPTLKLHFDVDPDLPPEPAPTPASNIGSSAGPSSSQRAMTPSRPLHLHSRTSSHNSTASLRSPPHSRPSSRAGRSIPGSSHPLASSRSASVVPDDGREALSASASSLISPSPGSVDRTTNAIPSIAAFLEDQLRAHDLSSSQHLGHESPTRRPRSNLSLESHTAQGSSLFAPQPVASPIDKNPAEPDELDVSTPRARPTTLHNFNIGIAGTIFHHDDDITDHEGESSQLGVSRAQAPSSTMSAGRAGRVVVPLAKRRQVLDEDAEGEQTPTKSNAMARREHQLGVPTQESGTDLIQDRAPKDNTLPAGIDAEVAHTSDSTPNGGRDKQEQTPHETPDAIAGMVDSDPGSAMEDQVEEADKGADDAGQEDEDEAVEEEEEEEDEEEEEEDEEDEDEDEDEDDLALEALDLEGY